MRVIIHFCCCLLFLQLSPFSLCRYDTDGNGYVDHKEFLAKLGGELAPGDIHGHSTQIAQQSQQVLESMYRNQQVCTHAS